MSFDHGTYGITLQDGMHRMQGMYIYIYIYDVFPPCPQVVIWTGGLDLGGYPPSQGNSSMFHPKPVEAITVFHPNLVMSLRQNQPAKGARPTLTVLLGPRNKTFTFWGDQKLSSGKPKVRSGSTSLRATEFLFFQPSGKKIQKKKSDISSSAIASL